MNREAEFVSLASAPTGWRAVFAYDDERAPDLRPSGRRLAHHTSP
jgi:hypothetical protein